MYIQSAYNVYTFNLQRSTPFVRRNGRSCLPILVASPIHRLAGARLQKTAFRAPFGASVNSDSFHADE